MPPETSISPLDILAARKRKEASVLSALEGEALNSAYEELDPKMGQREMTSALVTGLLPVLIGGLLKGKKGAAIGAGAGAKGSALYFEGMQEDEKLEREKAKARVQALREMRKSALAGADRAEGSEAYLQSKASKDMGKGTTVNILPEDKPISDVMIKEIKSEGGVSQMAGQTINDILNLMPDAMKKGYQGSDGEVSLSQAVNVWVERLKAKGLGIEAETGRGPPYP